MSSQDYRTEQPVVTFMSEHIATEDGKFLEYICGRARVLKESATIAMQCVRPPDKIHQ